MSQVRPFSPDDVLKNKIDNIPWFVIQAVNELLAQRFSGNSCIIKQEEIMVRAQGIAMASNASEDWSNRQSFYDNHWLDFETVYSQAGWKVIYDKPGYNESYDAFFKFARAK